MHVLFMKRELSILALLGTSSEMTIFSRVTISKIALIGIESADTKSTCVKSIFIGNACAENSYTRGANAIKHLEIESQSF